LGRKGDKGEVGRREGGCRGDEVRGRLRGRRGGREKWKEGREREGEEEKGREGVEDGKERLIRKRGKEIQGRE
jgi:hypothetical protein